MLEELFSLKGETAVVTGAGRGIGEGIARVLAGAGANVVCAARRTDEIERVASEIRESGGNAIGHDLDLFFGRQRPFPGRITGFPHRFEQHFFTKRVHRLPEAIVLVRHQFAIRCKML